MGRRREDGDGGGPHQRRERHAAAAAAAAAVCRAGWLLQGRRRRGHQTSLVLGADGLRHLLHVRVCGGGVCVCVCVGCVREVAPGVGTARSERREGMTFFCLGDDEMVRQRRERKRQGGSCVSTRRDFIADDRGARAPRDQSVGWVRSATIRCACRADPFFPPANPLLITFRACMKHTVRYARISPFRSCVLATHLPATYFIDVPLCVCVCACHADATNAATALALLPRVPTALLCGYRLRPGFFLSFSIHKPNEDRTR